MKARVIKEAIEMAVNELVSQYETELRAYKALVDGITPETPILKEALYAYRDEHLSKCSNVFMFNGPAGDYEVPFRVQIQVYHPWNETVEHGEYFHGLGVLLEAIVGMDRKYLSRLPAKEGTEENEYTFIHNCYTMSISKEGKLEVKEDTSQYHNTWENLQRHVTGPQPLPV